MEGENNNPEAVKAARHLADREHDYLYTRSSYFILSETVLLTAFVLAFFNKAFDLGFLIYTAISVVGLLITLCWVRIGKQHLNSLRVAKKIADKYEDRLPDEMRVYKDFRDTRKTEVNLSWILLRLIPIMFLAL